MAPGPPLPGPYYRHRRYLSRYAADGKDLHNLDPGLRGALDRGLGLVWTPEHPETEPLWEPLRLLIEYNGAITHGEVDAMLPEAVLERLDFARIIADVQAHQRATLRVDG